MIKFRIRLRRKQAAILQGSVYCQISHMLLAFVSIAHKFCLDCFNRIAMRVVISKYCRQYFSATIYTITAKYCPRFPKITLRIPQSTAKIITTITIIIIYYLSWKMEHPEIACLHNFDETIIGAKFQ
jgi:hypothetical protein